MRPAHPCSVPNCPELVLGSARCPAHTITREERNPKDPAQAKFYGSSRWQKLRAIIRRRDPICKMCNRAPSTTVHHKDNDWKNCTMENLEGACGPCHSRHSGSEHWKKRNKSSSRVAGGQ